MKKYCLSLFLSLVPSFPLSALSSCRVFGVPFYVGLLAPFIVIYLFNWVLFIVIIFNLLCKGCLSKFKESQTSEKKISLKQQLIITVTLSILFGLGWGIGLPATQELHRTPAVRNTFAALFIILTAFQGLFVFIMHCLRSKEARKVWSQWIFRVTGKEVDLSVSTTTPSQGNYWRQRRQQMKNKSIVSTNTNISYISSSGTLRNQVEKDMGVSLPPLESTTVDSSSKSISPVVDPAAPTSPCSNVAYELPQLTEKDYWGSHPSITSKGEECNGTQAFKNPIVKTQVDDRGEKTGGNEGESSRGEEKEAVVMVEETQLGVPVASSGCSHLPNPLFHKDSGNGGIVNGVDHH